MRRRGTRLRRILARVIRRNSEHLFSGVELGRLGLGLDGVECMGHAEMDVYDGGSHEAVDKSCVMPADGRHSVSLYSSCFGS